MSTVSQSCLVFAICFVLGSSGIGPSLPSPLPDSTTTILHLPDSTPSPPIIRNKDGLPDLKLINCSSTDNLSGNIDWTGSTLHYVMYEVACNQNHKIAKFREVIYQSTETIIPFKTTTANLTYVTPTRSNMCTAAVWATKVDMSNIIPRKVTVGPSFTSCALSAGPSLPSPSPDSTTTIFHLPGPSLPSPLPDSTTTIFHLPDSTPSPPIIRNKDGLPDLKLVNCSSTDNLSGNIDWTGSTSYYVIYEVACIQNHKIAKFREVIFQSPKTIFPFKTTTANLTYVTPTRSNMCTAAVWGTKVDMSNMLRKITVGPSFTSCTLITAVSSSLPLKLSTSGGSMSSLLPMSMVTMFDKGSARSQLPDVATLLTGVVLSFAACFIFILFSVIIVIAAAIKKWKNMKKEQDYAENVLKLDKLPHPVFLEDFTYDQDTILDNISDINVRYQLGPTIANLDRNSAKFDGASSKLEDYFMITEYMTVGKVTPHQMLSSTDVDTMQPVNMMQNPTVSNNDESSTTSMSALELLPPDTDNYITLK